jgi:AraC-like DNA-binding protein
MAPVEPLRIVTIFYREAGLDYHTPVHRHPVHQWYACLHGGMTILVDGAAHELAAGEALLVRPGQEREPYCRRRAPGYLVVIFECLGLELEPLPGRVTAIPGALAEDLRALVSELQSPRGGESPHLVQALVVRLLVGLKRQVQAGDAAGTPRDAANAREVAATIERFLAANLHRPITRAEAAATVNLSQPHVARLFRAATGRSFLARLTEMRLDRARELLLETSLPVSDIAGRVGLASFSHFTRLFTRHVGMVPTDYRRSGGRSWNPGPR